MAKFPSLEFPQCYVLSPLSEVLLPSSFMSINLSIMLKVVLVGPGSMSSLSWLFWLGHSTLPWLDVSWPCDIHSLLDYYRKYIHHFLWIKDILPFQLFHLCSMVFIIDFDLWRRLTKELVNPNDDGTELTSAIVNVLVVWVSGYGDRNE